MHKHPKTYFFNLLALWHNRYTGHVGNPSLNFLSLSKCFLPPEINKYCFDSFAQDCPMHSAQEQLKYHLIQSIVFVRQKSSQPLV